MGAWRDLANYAVAVNRLLQAEMRLGISDRMDALEQYMDAEIALSDRFGDTGFEAELEVL